MNRKPLGALVLCLCLLFSACPTQPGTGIPSSDTAISQLAIGGLSVPEGEPGHFSTVLDYSVTEVTITITAGPGATTTVTKAGTIVSPTEGSTFLLTGLSVGSNTYIITVEAEDTAISKDYSLVLTRAPLPPIMLPDAIALRSPANLSEGIGALPVLSWERSKSAVYWKVHFAEGSQPSTGAASGIYFLTEPEWVPPVQLECNKTYAWKVIPYDAAGTPLASSEIRTFLTGGLPQMAAPLTVTQVEGKPHLSLQWEVSVAADGYKIFRNGATSPVYISGSGAMRSWIDTAPNSGLNTYSVSAFNSFGYSETAAQATGTPSAGGTIIIIVK